MTDALPVVPIQGDRSAAGDYARLLLCAGKAYRDSLPLSAFEYRGGKHDDSALVQAFARHRITASAPLVEALEAVLRYRRGEGEYRFASLPADERDNAAFDAWQEIEAQIVTALAKIRSGS